MHRRNAFPCGVASMVLALMSLTGSASGTPAAPGQITPAGISADLVEINPLAVRASLVTAPIRLPTTTPPIEMTFQRPRRLAPFTPADSLSAIEAARAAAEGDAVLTAAPPDQPGQAIRESSHGAPFAPGMDLEAPMIEPLWTAQLIGPPLIPTRPVTGSPATLAAERDAAGELVAGDAPVMLTDTHGDVAITTSSQADRRYLLLQGGGVKARAVVVRGRGARLELDGTQFKVRQTARVQEGGEIVTHIHEKPAGLDLRALAGLGLPSGQLRLYFHTAPTGKGIHWGLRAEGDRRDELRQLVERGKIIAAVVRDGGLADAKIVIVFDGDYTYITIDPPVYDRPLVKLVRFGIPKEAAVPEPTMAGLLAAGGLALLRRRRST